MPDTRAPSPAAYMAHVTPFDVTHPSLRRLRLSARQVNALTARQIPIVIDGAAGRMPVAQAEIAIQDDTRVLLGRETCAVLWRDRGDGELHVMCGTSFVQVATVTVVPAQRQVRAA